jgi:hypothetical protein
MLLSQCDMGKAEIGQIDSWHRKWVKKTMEFQTSFSCDFRIAAVFLK